MDDECVVVQVNENATESDSVQSLEKKLADIIGKISKLEIDIRCQNVQMRDFESIASQNTNQYEAQGEDLTATKGKLESAEKTLAEAEKTDANQQKLMWKSAEKMLDLQLEKIKNSKRNSKCPRSHK